MDVGVSDESRCRDDVRVHALINFACDAIIRYNSYRMKEKRKMHMGYNQLIYNRKKITIGMTEKQDALSKS